MLPYALASKETVRVNGGIVKMREKSLLCCSCGNTLATVTLNSNISSATSPIVKMYPGYRQNSSGVFVRKRAPRTAFVWYEENTAQYAEHAGITINTTVTAVCHTCGTRQLIRGR